MTLYIVGIYFTVLLGIGWWSHRTRIDGMTDFLLAGRKLGLVLCAAAMAATHFGGGALMGGAAWGFEHGLSGAWYGISTGLGLLLLAFFTAGKFRDLALYTVPDFLARRYGGNAVRVIGASLSLVALTGILAAQVNAARGAFAILGVEGPQAAVLATLVFVAYTAIGGLWAATVSDLIQIVIAGAGIVIAAVVVWTRAADQGGLTEVVAAKGVDDGYFSFAGAGPELILWLVLPTVMYTLIGQDFYQRLFAAKDAGTARGAALLGGLFLMGISLFPTLVGIGARGFSDLDDRTQAVPWVLQNLVDPFVGGIILAAILAAIMSTADSLLTSASSHLVKDLWIETLGRGDVSQERQLLKITRGATVAVGLVALAIGLAAPGIVTLLIYSYTLYTAGVFVPMLGGVLWSGATRTGALAAMIGGSGTALAGILTGADLGGVPTEIYAALVSAVLFVAVSVLTSRDQASSSRRQGIS